MLVLPCAAVLFAQAIASVPKPSPLPGVNGPDRRSTRFGAHHGGKPVLTKIDGHKAIHASGRADGVPFASLDRGDESLWQGTAKYPIDSRPVSATPWPRNVGLRNITLHSRWCSTKNRITVGLNRR